MVVAAALLGEVSFVAPRLLPRAKLSALLVSEWRCKILTFDVLIGTGTGAVEISQLPPTELTFGTSYCHLKYRALRYQVRFGEAHLCPNARRNDVLSLVIL
jgi:hypothetical protein